MDKHGMVSNHFAFGRRRASEIERTDEARGGVFWVIGDRATKYVDTFVSFMPMHKQRRNSY